MQNWKEAVLVADQARPADRLRASKMLYFVGIDPFLTIPGGGGILSSIEVSSDFGETCVSLGYTGTSFPWRDGSL
jgi:hypothetical protein